MGNVRKSKQGKIKDDAGSDHQEKGHAAAELLAQLRGAAFTETWTAEVMSLPLGLNFGICLRKCIGFLLADLLTFIIYRIPRFGCVGAHIITSSLCR